MSAEALHPMLRRAPSVQDYERMSDRARRAAVALLRAEQAAVQERRRIVEENARAAEADRVRRAELAADWGATVRAEAAAWAVRAAERNGDTPLVQMARQRDLTDAIGERA